MNTEEQRSAYSKLVAKAWADEDFKAKLISNPTGVMKENGMFVPEGVEFKVMEEPANTRYLVLPKKPAEMVIQETVLRALGGKAVATDDPVCSSTLFV